MKKYILLFVHICISIMGFSNSKGTPILLRDSTIQVSKLEKDSTSFRQDTIKSTNVKPLENIETLNINNQNSETITAISKNPANSVKTILQKEKSKARIAPKQKTIPTHSRWSKRSN